MRRCRCRCDSGAMVEAAVKLFHARMAQLYNGLTVEVGGSGGWWTGDWTTREVVDGSGSEATSSTEYYWTGVRYEGWGCRAVYGYTPGKLEVAVSYTLENKGSWDDVNG